MICDGMEIEVMLHDGTVLTGIFREAENALWADEPLGKIVRPEEEEESGE